MNQYGIYQVTIPLPIWNDNVHCYLAQREGKWTIIDTAMNREETRECWTRAFSEKGIDPKRDVEQILITHHHPDHYDYADELQQQTGAAVFLSEKEQLLAKNQLDDESYQSFYRAAGMPEEMIKQLRPVNRPANQAQRNLQTIEPNKQYAIGELLFEALHMPGHSDGHICFYNREEQILLSGDHLTRETIPYISFHGNGDENPLATYFSTLENMKSLPISHVLPGHGPVFSDAQERIREILYFYEERVAQILSFVKSEMTAYEVSRVLWQKELPAFEQWVLLGETIACLRYLVSKGEIRFHEEDRVHRYRKM